MFAYATKLLILFKFLLWLFKITLSISSGYLVIRCIGFSMNPLKCTPLTLGFCMQACKMEK